MKRIFIGSFIEGKDVYKNYTKIKKDFSNSLKGKWVPKENLHITYKFLGNIDEEKIPQIQSVLDNIINKPVNINLTLKGISAFPNVENPKVVFIKVEDKDSILNEMYKTIENKLKNIGFEKENKPFIPHITVKRPKFVKKERFIEMVKNYEDRVLGKVNKIEVNVIESTLNPNGALYKKV